MPITILDLAKHRGAQEDPNGGFSAEAILNTGLPFLAGCGPCGESLVAFNAYPSKLGVIRCKDCIGTNGFETVEEANASLFGEEESCTDEHDCKCQICDPEDYEDLPTEDNDPRFD